MANSLPQQTAMVVNARCIIKFLSSVAMKCRPENPPRTRALNSRGHLDRTCRARSTRGMHRLPFLANVKAEEAGPIRVSYTSKPTTRSESASHIRA
jgi:hypothetical protein